jgi:thymidylate synthase
MLILAFVGFADMDLSQANELTMSTNSESSLKSLPSQESEEKADYYEDLTSLERWHDKEYENGRLKRKHELKEAKIRAAEAHKREQLEQCDQISMTIEACDKQEKWRRHLLYFALFEPLFAKRNRVDVST